MSGISHLGEDDEEEEERKKKDRERREARKDLQDFLYYDILYA